MNRLIAEPDVVIRSAYITDLHRAYLQREITPEEMVTLQNASMPWCEWCREAHSLVLVDGKHTCLACYQHTTEA